MKQYFAVFALLIISPLANASTLAAWDFEGEGVLPAAVAPGVIATPVTAAMGTIGFAAGNAPTPGTAASLTGFADGNRYEFTVSAARGASIRLTGLSFDDRASGTGPSGWSLYANGRFLADGMTHSQFAVSPMNTIPLSIKSVAGTTTFWLVGTGASSNSGTWRLDNLAIEGTISTVPVPLPAVLLGSAFLSLIGFRKRA